MWQDSANLLCLKTLQKISFNEETSFLFKDIYFGNLHVVVMAPLNQNIFNLNAYLIIKIMNIYIFRCVYIIKRRIFINIFFLRKDMTPET